MSDHILEGLKRKISVKEAEEAHLVSIPRLGDKPVPFGFINHKWVKLLSKMQDGDELWEYSNFPGPLCGSAGIVILREGKVVDAITTMIS